MKLTTAVLAGAIAGVFIGAAPELLTGQPVDVGNTPVIVALLSFAFELEDRL